MLITPHIVRDHELTKEDVANIYIGPQANVGLSGPPQLIAPQPEAPPAPAPAPPPAAAEAPAQPRPGNAAQPGAQLPPVAAPAGAQNPNQPAPPGTSPVPSYVQTPTAPPTVPPSLTGQPAPTAPAPGGAQPGQTTIPAPQPPPAVPPGAQPPATPPGTLPPVQQPPAAPAGTTPPAAGAPATPPGRTAPAGAPATTPTQVIITPPGTEFRVGGGPYTVPISVNNASRISTITLTITFNPAILNVRTSTDGTFMRQGGVTASFTPKIDKGRVDLVITRAGDQTGASGSGLLAALLFESVAAGTSTITINAVAMAPDGTPITIAASPVTVVVR
jgi:hypothetical protein